MSAHYSHYSHPAHPAARVACFFILILTAVSGLRAQDIYINEGETERQPSNILLPYGFGSETLDVAFGLLGISSATIQPQATIGAAVMGSTNGSYGIYMIGHELRAPFSDRLYVSPFLSAAKYKKLRSYTNGNPQFLGRERAGSSESSEDNYLEGEAWEIVAELPFRWVLPLGHGYDNPLKTITMQEGLPLSDPTGGTSRWDPWKSGRTSLGLKPFYRSREYKEDPGILQTHSNGLEFGLLWDNRDFRPSPTRGGTLELSLTRDFGWFDSDDSWTTWEANFTQNFSFGESDWARQRVLAFHFMTADTPTWDENGHGIDHRAPDFLSPRLGGWSNMRSYPHQRYNDRSAIYYGLEYRYMPRWNPLGNVRWLDDWLDIDWWQFVGFAEAGNVAPSFNLGDLHSDMKFDAGIGLRIMMAKSVVRLDWAMGEEGTGFWFMIGQTF